MRILHITAFALRGGCEKNCYHFCKETSDDRNEIIVLDATGPMSSAWQEIGVPVEHLGIVKKNLLSFGSELKEHLKGKTYDLVILWSTIRLPLQLHALNGVTGRVRVYLGNPLQGEYNSLKDRALELMFPYKSSVRLMACSAYVAESHNGDAYFGKFPMEVSLNPVALPDSFPEKHYVDGQFNLGMVARLDPIKDHKTVLTAFKEIKKNITNVKLHLVGDGVLRRELEEWVERENLTSSIHFYGDVADVYRYLNEWNVFVYATTHREGLGSVVEEAMANGLACLLSDLPMLRELAPEDGIVLWFGERNADELAKGVIQLYHHPELIKKLSAAAFEYAKEHFGIRRFVEAYFR